MHSGQSPEIATAHWSNVAPPNAAAELHARNEGDSPLALRYSQFRLFMAGSFVSWVGDWMDLAALNWAVLTLTGSAVALGVINACRLVPVFALSLPAGVLADRHDRRRLLIVLHLGCMVMTLVVGGLVATRSPFWLFAVAVTLRSLFASGMPPVRNAMTPNLVPAAALPSAIAGQTAVMNLSRIIGPALAGALLAVVSMESVFWINGASFAAVVLSLCLLRPDVRRDAAPCRRMRTDLHEAVTFVRHSPAVQSLLILAVVPMIFGFPYTPLMPLFAQELLHLGPGGFGALLAVSGAGALTGSAGLSLRRAVRRPGRWLIVSILVFGAALLAFVLARGAVWAGVAMFVTGLASQIYRTMSRITLQAEVPDALRGRILSIALMDRGLIPLGSVLLAAIADRAGVLAAGLVMGSGCIAVTLAVLAARRDIWRL